MKWVGYTSRQEAFANLLLWVVIFAAPTIGIFILSALDDSYTFRWHDILNTWSPLVVVLTAFLIHNYLIAPLLIYQNNWSKYLICTIVLMAVFVACQISSDPPPKPAPSLPQCETVDAPPSEPMDSEPPQGGKPIGGPHEYMFFSLLVFALGANLGIKLYFKTAQDNRRLNDLEKEKLEQELAYLRYQVNPHFFMNTLNNIHALVDINPEKAKTSIVKMSKFMRYLLYDCDVDSISLQLAVSLIEDYTELMRMRFSDNVAITFDKPDDDAPQAQVASLVYMPFIENAFKHGVSYNKPSFIHVSLHVKDDKIYFVCRNSKSGKVHDKGGVGLSNVTKRLELIYGERHDLHIEEDDTTYTVRLTTPTNI